MSLSCCSTIANMLSIFNFKVKIDYLNQFEEQAKKCISQAIQKWYPDNFNSNKNTAEIGKFSKRK